RANDLPHSLTAHDATAQDVESLQSPYDSGSKRDNADNEPNPAHRYLLLGLISPAPRWYASEYSECLSQRASRSISIWMAPSASTSTAIFTLGRPRQGASWSDSSGTGDGAGAGQVLPRLIPVLVSTRTGCSTRVKSEGFSR